MSASAASSCARDSSVDLVAPFGEMQREHRLARRLRAERGAEGRLHLAGVDSYGRVDTACGGPPRTDGRARPRRANPRPRRAVLRPSGSGSRTTVVRATHAGDEHRATTIARDRAPGQAHLSRRPGRRTRCRARRAPRRACAPSSHSGDCFAILPDTTESDPFDNVASKRPWCVVVSKLNASSDEHAVGPDRQERAVAHRDAGGAVAPVRTTSAASRRGADGPGIDAPDALDRDVALHGLDLADVGGRRGGGAGEHAATGEDATMRRRGSDRRRCIDHDDPRRTRRRRGR